MNTYPNILMEEEDVVLQERALHHPAYKNGPSESWTTNFLQARRLAGLAQKEINRSKELINKRKE